MRRSIPKLARLVAFAVLGAASSATAQTEPIFLRCAKADGAEIGVFGVFQNNLWKWHSSEGRWSPVGFALDSANRVGSQFFESHQSFSVVSYVGETAYETEINRVTGAYTYTSPGRTITGACEPTREPRPAPARF